MSTDETEIPNVPVAATPMVEPSRSAAARSSARNARLQLRMSADLKDRMRAYAARRHTTLSALTVRSFVEMLELEDKAGGAAG